MNNSFLVNKLISYFGKDEIKSNKIFGKDLSHVICITGGRGRCEIADFCAEIHTNTVIILPRGYNAKIIPADDVSLAYTAVSFDERAFSFTLDMPTFCADSFGFINDSEIAYCILSALDRLSFAQKLDFEDELRYSELILAQIIIIASSSGSDAKSGHDALLGERVERYLSENIDVYTGLEDLARRFFVSKYYLCRAFKKHTGKTIHSFINEKRLAYARALILGGEGAISVCYKVGFGDYSAFYRAYVKLYGTPPSATSLKGGTDGI